MKGISLAEGRKRIRITRVCPQVDGGKYPAKAVAGKEITISADVFTDGHDRVDTRVLLRHTSEKKWREFPMRFCNNDCWEYSFVPEKTGLYQFQITGRIDHFGTWQEGLLKKQAAGQDISVELEIGAALISEAALRAGTKDKKLLERYAGELQAAADKTAAVQLATQPELAILVSNWQDAALVTVYPRVLTLEAERTKAGFSTWYELFPRSTANAPGLHGTFRDVERLLPRIAEMGFDTLYLPPIHPIGESKRKGRNNSLTAGPNDPGSPWAIGSHLGGHKDIHPQLGKPADFRRLVREAGRYGIEIALDIAFQCAPDHPYVKEHPQWFTWRPDGTVQYAENPPKRYEDILPFNFETEDWENLWQELKSIVDHWISQGVNIFRIDNPHTKSFAFWEWMIAGVRSQHPQVIFLAEAFTRPRLMEQLARAGFSQSYTYFTWRNTRHELETYMKELTQTGLRDYFRPNFWPNTPDILPEVLVHGGENAHIMRLLLAATLSSNYGLYGPVYEFNISTPMPGKEEYTDNEKYEIHHWDWDRYTRTGELISRINRIRRENPALQVTGNILFATTTNEQLICYIKADKASGNILIIAVNLDPYHTQSAEIVLPLEKMGLGENQEYLVRDLLSGDKFRWQGSRNYVQLDPDALPAHILRIEQTQITATIL